MESSAFIATQCWQFIHHYREPQRTPPLCHHLQLSLQNRARWLAARPKGVIIVAIVLATAMPQLRSSTHRNSSYSESEPSSILPGYMLYIVHIIVCWLALTMHAHRHDNRWAAPSYRIHNLTFCPDALKPRFMYHVQNCPVWNLWDRATHCLDSSSLLSRARPTTMTDNKWYYNYTS